EALDPAHLDRPDHRAVAEAVFELGAMNRPCDISAVLALLDGLEAAAAASDLYLRMSHATTISDRADRNREEVQRLFRDCLRLLSGPAEVVPLEGIRQRHASTGGNRRAIPRPAG